MTISQSQKSTALLRINIYLFCSFLWCLQSKLSKIHPLASQMRRAETIFILSKGPNEYVSSPIHLRTETDPVSETLCLLVSRIPDDGQGPETQQF
jgi:hypothetical protein